MNESSAHRYDDEFFDYVDIGARRSARKVVALVSDHLPVSSVLDVGCGRGIWVDEWHRVGVIDAFGVDGGYVDTGRLAVPAKHFAAFDLSLPFRLGRHFDLVQSLEVAEHIPPTQAEVFVDNLTAHGDVIMFSGAVPGQGGEFHVNEQPYEYWRERFAARGFLTFDFIRPRVAKDPGVEPWYRYNTLLFVRGCAVGRLPSMIAETEVVPGERISNVAPLPW